MDPITEQAREWLDRRYARRADGSYLAHQPIDGLWTTGSEPNALLRMARTLQIISIVHGLDFTSALDVGGGEGYLSAIVRDLTGREARNVDISVEACHRAREIFGIQSYSADATRLPLADGAFDLVMASEVIEHLARPVVAISEMVRVSRRYVLITTEEACLTGDIERRLRMAVIETGYPHAERNWFTAQDFRVLLGEDVGLCSQRLELTQRSIDRLSRERWDRARVEALLRHLTAMPALDARHKGLIVLLDKFGVVDNLDRKGTDERMASDDSKSLVFHRLLGHLPAVPVDRSQTPAFGRELDQLRCTVCRGHLKVEGDRLLCLSCAQAFPVMKGVPIFLHEVQNLSTDEDSVRHLAAGDPRRQAKIRTVLKRLHGERPSRVSPIKKRVARGALRLLSFISRPGVIGEVRRRLDERMTRDGRPGRDELDEALPRLDP